ncbi:probable inactive peptidyl-prolyl cis-trans isomerase-like 6 [Hylaeus volcanicus]|uniref:probable inactive peptidyl-prolyl cis-trans isomerase-like 6 n=1 Tax=Hylaeus volcanicus TaxID=313075 RepID=UPI0023B8627C|nr:probable inactive peptidyl-prolyl cis-trans isomerase-like 6 [Hylaeus volcanicus]
MTIVIYNREYSSFNSVLSSTMTQNKNKSGLLKKHFCSNFVDNDCVKIKVVGIINTVAFQKARICAEKLHQHLPFKYAKPQIIEMFQIDWHEYIQKKKRQIGGKIWLLTQPVAVFIDDEYIGCDAEFLYYISESYIFSLPIGIEYYETLATERCKQFMEKSKRKYVYFTFTVDGSIIGSFMFMLYSDLLPLTCQHFLNLCTGYDEVTKTYKDSYFVNTCVHRIVKNGWLQCGGTVLPKIKDSVNDVKIPDESYCIPHDRRGVLSMVNSGKHSNESQFIICLKPNPWMNYFYVAFGQLVDGARALKTLENMSTYYEQPIKQIVISYCGEYVFLDEPKLETESKVFLEHKPPLNVEGEDTKLSDIAFDFYSITPWLDNIMDKIDIRDVPSILMAERYLNGLYSLSTDYLPGMDMRIYEEIHLISKKKYDTTAAMLRELLLKFHPDSMTQEEKLTFISEISKIILAYVFCYGDNKFCLEHISIDTREIIHKILEVAHEIALKAISRAEISHKCGDLKIAKIFEAKQINSHMLISESCILLLHDILNEAVLCLIRSVDIQE